MYYLLPTYSLLVYIVYLLEEHKKIDKALWYIVVHLPVVLFLFFFVGLRDEQIGTDTLSYKALFDYSEEGLEPAFVYVSTFVKAIGGQFQVFIALFFLLAFLPKFYSFLHGTVYPALAILVYSGFWLMVYEMNAIRQGLALGLVALAIYFLLKNNTRKFYITMLFAVLSHYTAIVFLPFALITKLKCSNTTVFILFGGALFLAIINFSEYLFDYLSQFTGLDFRLIDKAMSYQQNEKFNNSVLYSFKTFSRFFIFFTTVFFVQRIKVSEQTKRIFLWSALLNIVIYLLFSKYEIIATRLSLYYRFTECFFFAYLPTAFRGKVAKVAIGFLLYVYVLLQVRQTLIFPGNYLEPYKSILYSIL